MPVRTVIERGPKGKRSVAFSIDWPGWSRGAKTAELALETLESYRERYRPVAGLAGMAREFEAAGPLLVVEDKVGTGSVDFWGISFSPSAAEQGPMGEAELERAITLLRACWAYFDGVAARVSPEMRKGPRGGGRDRDRIIRHTIRTESEEFAKQLSLRIPEGAALTPDGLRHHREAYRRGDARVQRRRGHAAHAVVDASLSHPPLRLPHARPCVGDGGQGPIRLGTGPTRHSPGQRSGSALRGSVESRRSVNPPAARCASSRRSVVDAGSTALAFATMHGVTVTVEQLLDPPSLELRSISDVIARLDMGPHRTRAVAQLGTG